MLDAVMPCADVDRIGLAAEFGGDFHGLDVVFDHGRATFFFGNVQIEFAAGGGVDGDDVDAHLLLEIAQEVDEFRMLKPFGNP